MTDQTSTPATGTDPLAELDEFSIELPSWAFGNAGTRFQGVLLAGVPRDPFEKVSDAAQVHRLTGLAPRVSLHIPWDLVPDERGGFDALAAHAREEGVTIGAVNSNLFQDDDYRLGSLAHPEKRVRDKAIAHHAQCVDVMRATGSRDLKAVAARRHQLPGQDSLRGRRTGWPTPSSRSTRSSTRRCGCWSSTSCSSLPSTRWTSPTGGRR